MPCLLQDSTVITSSSAAGEGGVDRGDDSRRLAYSIVAALAPLFPICRSVGRA